MHLRYAPKGLKTQKPGVSTLGIVLCPEGATGLSPGFRTCLAPCIRPKGRAEKTAIDSCVVVGTRSWTIRIGTSDGRPGCTASDRVRTPARPAWHAPRRRKAMIETPICGSVLQTCYPGRAGVRLRSMAVHRRLASNVLQRTTRGARPYQCPAADRARPGFRRPFGPGAGYTALNTYNLWRFVSDAGWFCALALLAVGCHNSSDSSKPVISIIQAFSIQNLSKTFSNP